jgi:DNA-binding MarR family transcriptional regulator
MSSERTERIRYIGASMRLVWQWIWARNFEAVVRAGYDDLNPAHVSLFRYPTLDGCRPTEIAHQMQITKQSAHELIGHLETRGYLVREPDPADRRARVVRLTPEGQQLETLIRTEAHHAEQQIAATLGPRRFAQLRHALDDLVATLPSTDHEPTPRSKHQSTIRRVTDHRPTSYGNGALNAPPGPSTSNSRTAPTSHRTEPDG